MTRLRTMNRRARRAEQHRVEMEIFERYRENARLCRYTVMIAANGEVVMLGREVRESVAARLECVLAQEGPQPLLDFALGTGPGLIERQLDFDRRAATDLYDTATGIRGKPPC